MIDNTDYWDSRVDILECNYFSDEVKLIFKNTNYVVTYSFKECYKVLFEHIKSYKKNIPVRDMSYAQIPYFLSEVTVDETSEQENILLTCKINMFPLNVEIWCKDIIIQEDPLVS